MSQPPTIQSTLSADGNVTYIDTIQAYDQWANVYDTDGNFLQALDTIEMRSLLPEFWTQVKKQYFKTQQSSRQPCKLVDLGCGTGRNTLLLLATACQDTIPSPSPTDNGLENSLGHLNTQIIGLDASNGMLDVARQRVQDFQQKTVAAAAVDVQLAPFDLLTQSSSPAYDAKTLDLMRNTDGMISTLVAEHIPLDTYFAAAAAIIRPGGYFLVTNMHAEMGRLSQAGFVDSVTGKKVRPSRSYAHDVTDLLAEAVKAGFEVVVLPSTAKTTTPDTEAGIDGVVEKKVTQDMVEKLGERSRKYVGVAVWLGVCLRKI